MPLTEDPERTHVEASRDSIVAIYESTNQPLVQIPGRSAQAASAAVIAVRLRRGFEVVVVLTHVEAQENVVYVPGELVPDDQLRQAVDEALNFAESMGFILDSTGWSKLDAGQKEAMILRMNAFQPPHARKLDLPVARPKPPDTLSAVARLFAAFALLLGLGAAACSGMTAEQRARSAEIHYDLGTNLLQNPNAEDGPGAKDSRWVGPVPAWRTIGNFTVVNYGVRGFPTLDEAARTRSGDNFFAGGPKSPHLRACQVIDVSDRAPLIDTGKLRVVVGADQAGWNRES